MSTAGIGSLEASLKADLAPAVERIIEWTAAANLDVLRPGAWSPGNVSMDLFGRIQRVEGRDFVKECREARLMGVNEIRRLDSEDVQVIAIDELSDHRSFQRPIARALTRKASGSLGVAKTRGYVTMLAVGVERPDTVEYLRDGVKLPDFGPAIDHMYLFVRQSSGQVRSAFYANRTRQGRRLRRMELSSKGENGLRGPIA
jgi:hypothetical protein